MSIVYATDYNIAMGLCRKRLHEMTPGNTYVNPRGSKVCRACVVAADALRYAPGQTCSNGHDLTEENVRVTPGGRRHCMECAREYDKPRTARLAVERAALRPPRITRRERNLSKYGLTIRAYDAMLAGQGGVCAICGTEEPGGRWNTYFQVDHNHQTGDVRGLLCSHCNVMLGNANDDPDRLRAAAEYLERS